MTEKRVPHVTVDAALLTLQSKPLQPSPALCIGSYELAEGYQYRRCQRLHHCNLFSHIFIFIGRTTGPF